ncbi:HsdM family class I SAM-dependent methyltransferase [Fervidibacter sacchari]
MRRAKPEPRVVSRVRQTLQRLGYNELVDFDYEVAVPYGRQRLWADMVLFESGIPIVLVEAEGTESALQAGFEEARLKAIGLNPEDPVPLIWVAAGRRDQCYCVTIPDKRAGVRYEPMGERPETLLRPERLTKLIGDYLQRQNAELALEVRYRQEFHANFQKLRGNDHKRCQDIIAAIKGIMPRTAKPIRQLLKTLQVGRPDFDIARAFRWLMRRYFRPLAFGRGDPVRRYGRFFTPSEVIRPMVEAIDPKPHESVLDFACGSGGFLLHAAEHLSNCHKASPSKIAAQLVGYDWDETCVGIAQTVLSLALAVPAGRLNIRQGDGLQLPQQEWGEESFDVVLSNPPAGDLPEDFSDASDDDRILQSLPKLYEVAFLVQAVRMAKEGGRIVIIVPHGILANEQLKPLRKWLLERVKVCAIVTLPRGLFPFTPSKMSVVVMQKVKQGKSSYCVRMMETERQNFERQLGKALQVRNLRNCQR